MSKTKRFEIHDQEPNGPTFDEDGKGSGIYGRLAGAKNKKRPDRFGINCDEPEGVTFEKAGSHIDFPKADRGTPMESKVVASSSGQGEYEPAKSGPVDFGGSVPVGKSAPKHGREMKKMSRFTR